MKCKKCGIEKEDDKWLYCDVCASMLEEAEYLKMEKYQRGEITREEFLKED